MSASNEEWVVDRILQRGNDKGIIKYKVLWKGYPPEQATWEPIEHLEHCKEAIYEFESTLKKLQNQKGAVQLPYTRQQERAGSQPKPDDQEEIPSTNHQENVEDHCSKEQKESLENEEAAGEPQAPISAEVVKEGKVQSEVKCEEKEEKAPIDEALPTVKREFEPSNPKKAQEEKSGKKKIKKLEIEEKNEVINNPSEARNAQTKDAKGKTSRLFVRQLSRYAFCDKQYELQQKTTLGNIMRKITGQERIKAKPIFIDITKTSDLIDIFDGVHQIAIESHLSSLDLLVKIDYGWVAIGKTEGQYVMIDVNLIKQDSWQVFVEWLHKKEGK